MLEERMRRLLMDPQRCVRDYIVIKVCYAEKEPIDSCALTHFVTKIFREAVDPNLHSQMAMSYQTVCDWGMEQDTFASNIRGIFGQMDDSMATQLYKLYRHCTTRCPFTSKQRWKNNKRDGKRRERSASPDRHTDARSASRCHLHPFSGSAESSQCHPYKSQLEGGSQHCKPQQCVESKTFHQQ